MKSYAVAKRGGHRSDAYCGLDACAALPRGRRPFETYTHVFMDCPAARPVVDWLRQLWHAVAGALPPDDPAVLLWDCAELWLQYPGCKPRQMLWSFLRVTVLYHIWDTHQRRRLLQAADSTPAAVVRRCINSITSTMHHLFYRSSRHQHLIEHLPHALLSEEVLETALDTFVQLFCDGEALCSVYQLPGGDKRYLRVLLSDVHPVPVPG